MCIFRRPAPPPPAPPLPPPPAPPVPPAPPAPQPTPLESDVNPQIRRARTKKAAGEQAKGTSALRIPLNQTLNTGQNVPAGGLNQ
tara:strand:- start:2792 stop:3046 length:255 start_codon:yes stop_codon:yes gene_type:complete